MSLLSALAWLFTILAVCGGIAALGCLVEGRKQRHAASCHVVGCAYRSEPVKSKSWGYV